MKIVNPDAVVLTQSGKNIYEFVELAGRTCYKSEDKITPDSAVAFVQRLKKSGHMAMLEHGIVYVVAGEGWNLGVLLRMSGCYVGSPLDRYFNTFGNKMSGSLRAFAEMFDSLFGRPVEERSKIPTELAALCCVVCDAYPEVFTERERYYIELSASHIAKTMADYMDNFKVVTRDEFEAICIEEKDECALVRCLCHTVKFTTDRGVTHELVRHRPCSFAQESTRYCNYSKGKYGSEITVVMPAFALFGDRGAKYQAWQAGCEAAEKNYMAMLGTGATAQQARALLPNSVKADIIVTATEKEWHHILKLRLLGTTGAPQPDMRYVMAIAAKALGKASHGRLDAIGRCLKAHELYLDKCNLMAALENASDKKPGDTTAATKEEALAGFCLDDGDDPEEAMIEVTNQLADLWFNAETEPEWLASFVDYIRR